MSTVQSKPLDYLTVGYASTKAMFNKKATSENSVLAVAEKVGYVAFSAFLAVAETLKNVVYGLANVLGIAPYRFAASLWNGQSIKAKTEDASELPDARTTGQWMKDGVKVALNSAQEKFANAKAYVLSTRVAGYAQAHPKQATGAGLGLAAVAGYATAGVAGGVVLPVAGFIAHQAYSRYKSA